MKWDYKRKVGLLAIGVVAMTAATAIGFLAHEIAEWFAEIVFSWGWSPPPKLARSSPVAESAG